MSAKTPRGATLIELVMFMVIVGVAMAGFFAAYNTIVKASADPQARKQVLAIAESLMDEVALMPFTFCDPNDANAATATSSAGCASASNSEDVITNPGGKHQPPPAGPLETRGSATNPLVNVSGYNGFSMSGINDLTNNPVSGLGAYSASVTVSQAALGSGSDTIAAATGSSLLVSVTVTGPNGVSVTLEGYRTRYAPNTAP